MTENETPREWSLQEVRQTVWSPTQLEAEITRLRDAIAAKDREIAELRARIPAQGEYERQEAICVEAAMSQWERSLKRPDMQEKDRIRGAVEAYKRQAFAFTLPIRSLGKEGSEE